MTPTQRALHDEHRARQQKFFPSQQLKEKAAELALREQELLALEDKLQKEKAAVANQLASVRAGWRPRGRPTLKEIISVVSAATGLTDAEILSHRRNASNVEARHIVFYAAKKLTPLSYAEIGRRLERDHTSVMHGCHKIENLLQRDEKLSEFIAQIFAKLEGAQ